MTISVRGAVLENGIIKGKSFDVDVKISHTGLPMLVTMDFIKREEEFSPEVILGRYHGLRPDGIVTEDNWFITMFTGLFGALLSNFPTPNNLYNHQIVSGKIPCLRFEGRTMYTKLSYRGMVFVIECPGGQHIVLSVLEDGQDIFKDGGYQVDNPSMISRDSHVSVGVRTDYIEIHYSSYNQDGRNSVIDIKHDRILLNRSLTEEERFQILLNGPRDVLLKVGLKTSPDDYFDILSDKGSLYFYSKDEKVCFGFQSDEGMSLLDLKESFQNIASSENQGV